MGVQSEKELKDGARGALPSKLHPDFTIKDSGERTQFASGMVRDVTTGKQDTELIFNGPMADRWADHLTKGAAKYPDVRLGVPNWTLAAGEEELVRARKSAARHFRQWMRGDTDEDHGAATFFNINLYEYVKDKMIAEFNAELDNPARELPPSRHVEPELKPEFKQPTHELVQAGKRMIMLPTPTETLRRIKQIEREEC